MSNQDTSNTDPNSIPQDSEITENMQEQELNEEVEELDDSGDDETELSPVSEGDTAVESVKESSIADHDSQKAFSIMQVEDMIVRQLADMDKKREELKILKSSFDDAFKNDAKYKEFDDKVKDATRLRTAYKQAMLKDPSIAQANTNYLTAKDEMKDMQMALSEYIKEYYRTSGLSQFQTQDGQILEIIQTFKLQKKG